MKHSKFIAAVLAVACLVAPAIAQDKIKFTKKAITKGTKVTSADKKTMTMDQTMSGDQLPGGSMTMKMKQEESTISTITALEVNEKGISKATVLFKTITKMEKTENPMQGPTEESETSPLPGNTYTIGLKDGVLSAKNAEGEDVKPEELTALTKQFEDSVKKGTLFDPYQDMGEVLNGKEMSIGEKVTLDKETVKKIMGDGKQDVDAVFVMTLKGKKTVFGVECAVFDVAVEVEKPDEIPEGMEFGAEITGEWVIGISNLWSYNIKVGGPITGGGAIETPEMTIELGLTGRMDMTGMRAFVMPAAK